MSDIALNVPPRESLFYGTYAVHSSRRQSRSGGIARFGSTAKGSIRARDYVVVSDESKETLPAQAVQTANGVRLAWILPALAANASRSFTLQEGAKGGLDSRPVSSTGQAFRGNDAAVTVADGRYGLDIHLNGELFHHLSPRGRNTISSFSIP